MKLKEIIQFLDSWAPSFLQESYDNSGLLIGSTEDEIHSALITLDVTEEVIDEAIENGHNLIIAHHPFIFRGIKKIGKTHWIDRCIRKAIKNDLCIFAIHTNLDNVHTGVNLKIAEKIGLSNVSVLSPKSDTLSKLTFFAPEGSEAIILESIYKQGAGNVGNYDQCSFQVSGTGTFRGNEKSNPKIGTQGKLEEVQEKRIEVLVPKYKERAVIQAMKASHPYEEVAYYLTPLANSNQEVGAGMIGELEKEMSPQEFLSHLKESMHLKLIRCADSTHKKIHKIAVCGGSGSFLLGSAMASGADAFVTADFKYHDFFEGDGKILIADIGHYESEVFTKELLQDVLTKKFTKFAFRLSMVNTNPIKYL